MREYLKRLRNKKGFTQLDAAKKLGISEGYYSLIEKGERQSDMPISMVKKLANVFEVPIEVILEKESEVK